MDSNLSDKHIHVTDQPTLVINDYKQFNRMINVDLSKYKSISIPNIKSFFDVHNEDHAIEVRKVIDQVWEKTNIYISIENRQSWMRTHLYRFAEAVFEQDGAYLKPTKIRGFEAPIILI